ncbi:hypothetical protein [Brevibacillus brevis]|uniref:hypothetical protein n=1 Tax=Brevibacillus brevis TaxID=1393 RepID=UPI0025A511BF|nr:hypothetical protein [Brevibacillus brevis]WJQ79829.1 hypothetical protein QN310_20390 [Brevibacillus brevis]
MKKRLIIVATVIGFLSALYFINHEGVNGKSVSQPGQVKESKSGDINLGVLRTRGVVEASGTNGN